MPHTAVRLDADSAARAAHDLSNFLQMICAYCDELREAAPGDDRNETLELLLACTKDASATVRRFLGRGTRGPVSEPLDVVRAVRDMSVHLAHITWGKTRLDVRLPEEPLEARISRADLQQVVCNLVSNSRDALEGADGVVSVVVERVPFVEEWRGAAVCISVTDNGPGMPSDTAEHAFEVGFSTKPWWHGSGYGLPIVRDVVVRHGGRVSLRSEPGQGTDVTVLLPVEGATSDSATQRTAAPVTSAGPTTKKLDHQQVLLVESDPLVNRLTTRLLTRDGHTVVSAHSISAALDQLLRANTQRPDVVIVDWGLAERNGGLLVLQSALERDRPEERPALVLMSGDVSVRSWATALDAAVLVKPFNGGDLQVALEQALSGERGPRD